MSNWQKKTDAINNPHYKIELKDNWVFRGTTNICYTFRGGHRLDAGVDERVLKVLLFHSSKIYLFDRQLTVFGGYLKPLTIHHSHLHT